MAYIYPNSRIDFFEDLGLSQDYNDTLYFPTTKAKDDYFSAILQTGHTAQKSYYVREKRGFVRVELPMTLMIKMQYMRFRNTSYDNKWWYAFVKSVNYINDNTTEVEYEIDPMLTWMGEFELADCFVERQHSETDDIGDNLVDEPLNTGEYVTISDENTGLFDKWVYAVFYTPTALGEVAFPDSHIYTQLGLYSGLSVRFYNDDFGQGGQSSYVALFALHTFLVADGITENVQMVLHIPEKFIPRIPAYVQPVYVGAPDYSDPNRQLAPVKYDKYFTRNTSLDGNYVPWNKKLFTYPYNFLSVWNAEGKENVYRYELFADNDSTMSFKILSNIAENTECMAIPMAYRGISLNYSEACTMKDFAQCSWASDAFMAFIAQTLSSAPVRLLAGAQMDMIQMRCNDTNAARVSTTTTEMDNGTTYDSDVNFANGNGTHLVVNNKDYFKQTKEVPMGYARPPLGEIMAIRGSLLDGFQHLTTPSSVHGAPSNPILEVNKDKDFWFYKRSIRKEYAEMIDGFFTMFGYAQKRVMKPNMHARQRFTYVQTKGCKIHCNCPASDADFIEGLFNKGIRFWTKHMDIGKYNLGANVNPNPLLPQGS